MQPMDIPLIPSVSTASPVSQDGSETWVGDILAGRYLELPSLDNEERRIPRKSYLGPRKDQGDTVHEVAPWILLWSWLILRQVWRSHDWTVSILDPHRDPEVRQAYGKLCELLSGFRGRPYALELLEMLGIGSGAITDALESLLSPGISQLVIPELETIQIFEVALCDDVMSRLAGKERSVMSTVATLSTSMELPPKVILNLISMSRSVNAAMNALDPEDVLYGVRSDITDAGTDLRGQLAARKTAATAAGVIKTGGGSEVNINLGEAMVDVLRLAAAEASAPAASRASKPLLPDL